MTPRRRWALVAVTAVVLACLPAAIAAWPAESSDVSASTLRARIAESGSVDFSGSAKTTGTLQVPDSKSFGGVAQLLGESNDLRAWWRSSTDWRVDRIRATGETDLVRNGGRITRWSFESRTATVSPVSTIRLPDASDLLPPTLARRMLQGARPGELSRLPSRRIAGLSAAGLRLEPADPAATIDRVDMWADPKTGLPLEVRLFATGDDRPVVSSRMRDVDFSRLPSSSTRFLAPRDARVRFDPAVDVAAGANAFSPFIAPDRLAGFDHRAGAPELSAVGVYGRGPTSFLALPLRHRVAEPLRERLGKNTTAEVGPQGTMLRVGPLTLLLTPHPRSRNGGSFLLAGTVTPETLQRAALDLLQAPGRIE